MADEKEVPTSEVVEPTVQKIRRRTRDSIAQESTVSASITGAKSAPANAESPRRKIPGNIPYTFSPNILKRVLERIPEAEKPPVFSPDFLATVLEASGGAARPIIPILKSTQMLNQGGVPTELYSQFQTVGGRSAAALQALKNGFPEIYRRNSYAHNAPEGTVIDILVAITGLTKNDRILKSMLQTFQCFQDYAKGAKSEVSQTEIASEKPHLNNAEPPAFNADQSKPLQLIYNINVVLPETTNIDVFNAIFKSLKGNLLN
ncbi:DUF5343 domain-containing protein [Labrys sp. LIt4]|uniref:DUF5343 domain-containing protein n=1 Tax=Labrys sp. LIt4 TaxID=2821355 RepID=UPI001AE0C8A3|nr:DUF5343 domain-containing protein [Labrys sp. LIt4]MBP0580623.1 DUF5343 domain-containing protein [Labrys sp. LIt4]